MATWRHGRTRRTIASPDTAAPGRPGSPASTSAPGAANPFFTARFTASVNHSTFGQDPSWTADGRVLSNEDDPSGVSQIYVSRLDGTEMSCLTCGQPGPNGFPQE